MIATGMLSVLNVEQKIRGVYSPHSLQHLAVPVLQVARPEALAHKAVCLV